MSSIIHNKVINILLIGVGGQGIILATRILADALVKSKFDVKQSEIHGMAQRGGSVSGHLRFGKKVFSPLIKKGDVDYLIAFEKLEALRYLEYLSKNTIVILNNQKIEPPSVAVGVDEYPENIEEIFKKNIKKVILVDSLQIAKDLGDIRTTNLILLGVLSNFLPVKKEIWEKSIKEILPEKIWGINLKAFESGRKY